MYEATALFKLFPAHIGWTQLGKKTERHSKIDYVPHMLRMFNKDVQQQQKKYKPEL